MPESPKVRVVVINFDGGQMTIDCLVSLLATDWPADRLEIVLVDNGSLDDVVERVRAELPQVSVIEPLANTGFARGCNIGILADGNYDLVALVNNDATVSPHWLRPLVEVLDRSASVGAACPKMVFDGKFVEVSVEVPGAASTPTDSRTLGVCVIAARLDGVRDDRRLAFDEGFFPPQEPSRERGQEFLRWSWRRGRVRVRVDNDAVPSRLSLLLVASDRRQVILRTERAHVQVDVDTEPRWVDVELDDRPFDVINNAGSSLYRGGFGGDRGFLERDDGSYDEPTDVFAWCGGAVLLSPAYLRDVGHFDERLFLYYEDTDLSWRGRLRGWTYQYEPRSVVRHRHASSSQAGSPTFRFFTERNRPLVLAKNAPASLAWTAGIETIRRAFGVIRRDLVWRPLTLRMPYRPEVDHQWKVVRSYLRLLPAMLRARWFARPLVSRASLMSWVQTKDIAR